MAEPYGAARHLVAEDGMIATAAANNAAVSEEAAQPSKTTVSQWQTCAEANYCVDRDITTSRSPRLRHIQSNGYGISE